MHVQRAMAAESTEVIRASAVESSLGVFVAMAVTGTNNEVARASAVEASVASSVALSICKCTAALSAAKYEQAAHAFIW